MKLFTLIFFTLFGISAFAQPLVNKGFASVNNIVGAREAALSGFARSINDNDLSLAVKNPTLLNEEIKGEAVFSYNPWFDGISSGFAAYAFQYKNFIILPSVGFFSYGQFDATDELGNVTGTFSARDLQLSLGSNYIINERLRVGANIKYFNSKYESVGASFVAVDLLTAYANDEKLFYATLGLENVGVALGNLDSENQGVPANLYVSLSKKLANAPFRFIISLNQLNRWKIVPEGIEENNNNTFGEAPTDQKIGFGRTLFFHTKLATELVITKNFLVRVGYNYQRREELKLAAVPGTSGFTYGFEFKVNRFRLAYARARYHAAFANNYFTISTNINKFK